MSVLGGTTPGTVRLSASTVAQYLTSQTSLPGALERGRRVVVLRSDPHWDGPPEMNWGPGHRARVAIAISPLAVHELVLNHLSEGGEAPALLVVLTDREQTELDPAILARVHKQRIEAIDRWNVVRQAFGAEEVDPQLRQANWAAEALLDAVPPGGWPQVAGGVLPRRVAMSELAARRLRLGRYAAGDDHPLGGDLDTYGLMSWTLDPGGPERFLSLRAPERAGLAAFLSEEDQAGAAGRALLALVAAERGTDAVPFGLVCAALWQHAEADAPSHRVRGRAERWFGEEPPAEGEAFDVLVRALGSTCEEFVTVLLGISRTDPDEERSRHARRITTMVLDRAGAVSRQLGAETQASASPVLPAGLRARFATAGLALASGEPAAIAQAVRELDDHRLAAEPDARVRIDRVRMAERLTRWLATDPVAEPTTVAAAVQRHVAETGWVDLALDHLESGGDPEPAVKVAYDTLADRVRESRRAIDRSFATALATWTSAGTDPGSMLTVETFLHRVVRPVVTARTGRRILLLVLDGMSAAIAGELGEELRRHWAEYDPLADAHDGPRRRGMAAALPTVTAVSRTSLFAGRLIRGTQADEARLFPLHRFWGGAPAAVFHKDDLRGGTAGETFGPALAEALADGRTHVAVVLNTIDDRLAKEQKLGDGAWRLDQIGMLRELLSAAVAERMAVIITSDHGHVVDRHGARAAGDGAASARHRAPGGEPLDEEVQLSGPRVLSPDTGDAIVALWDADSHYTSQQAGYHGGASLSEVTIPVLAYLPFGSEPPKGWRELGDQHPAWWSSRPQAVQAAPVPPSRKPAKQKRTPPPLSDALFDVAPVPAEHETTRAPEPRSSGDGLVEALLASEIFCEQVGLLARKPPIDKVKAALHVLLDAGTLPSTALAQRVGYPVARADGFAAVLRQLLNYEGVQVLETLPDGRTLRLNTGLLREQFELARY